MPYVKRLSPSNDALAVFHAELARAAVNPEQAAAGPALWPRFAGYYQGLARLPRRLRRALQRRWRRSLGGIALLLALGQAPALAETLAVARDIAPAVNFDGKCSLIEAIDNANADFPERPHLDCPEGGSYDTLVLPASSTQRLTQGANPGIGDIGLVITSTITIEGNGSTIMRDAPGFFRIFTVQSNGSLTLNNTTVSGGGTETGGGARNYGILTLTNSTVSGNSAEFGAGVYNEPDATLILTNSTVSGNSAGGGVWNFGTLTLSNSTVSGNSGRGLVNASGTATLTNSTVSANSAGGGVYNYGTLTLRNSTVSGNSALNGGGVSNYGTLTLTQALVSGNAASVRGAELDNLPPGTVIANAFNLFGHNGLTNAQAFSGFTPGPNDRNATSDSDSDFSTALGGILDTTLSNNGGPTQTHELVAGSPALNAVATGCPATDQRGVSRPQPLGGDCDIGAFERITDRTADLAVDLTDSPDPLTVGQTLAYTMTVTNTGTSQATGVQVIDSLPQGVALVSRPTQCTGTSTVTCNLGPLPGGEQTSVTITVIPTVRGTVGNTVHVVANEPDPISANNSDAETTTVNPLDPAQADLAITAAAGPEPAASGQTLTYTLTVRNDGPATATGVQLTDILPPGVVLGQITPSQGTCGGTGPVLCDLGALPSGGQATVAIDIVPAQAGILTNQATVNGNQSEPNPGNNSATTTTTVEPPLEPTSGATCGTLLCALRLACNRAESLGENCENRVTLFVNVPADRVSVPSDRVSDGLSARRSKRVRFAFVIGNVPPAQTKNVRLKLTARGKETIKQLIQQGTNRLRGVMEIRNSAGGTDTIRRLKVRLK